MGSEGPSTIVARAAGQTRSGTVEFRTDKWAEIYAAPYRRDHRRAQEQRRAGILGRPASDQRPELDRRRRLSQRSLSCRAPRRPAPSISNVWDRLSSMKAENSPPTVPDYEGQDAAGCVSATASIFTQIRRAQAGAINCPARIAPLHEHSLATGIVPDRAGRALAGRRKSGVRPLAGPVVPLTSTPGNSDELLGGAGTASAHGDAIATRVSGQGRAGAGPPAAPTISPGAAETVNARRQRRLLPPPRRISFGGSQDAPGEREKAGRARRAARPARPAECGLKAKQPAPPAKSMRRVHRSRSVRHR